MQKPTKAVLKICTEIEDAALNDMESVLYAAHEIKRLREMVDQAAPLIESYASHTTTGSQFLAEWKRRKADRKRKKVRIE